MPAGPDSLPLRAGDRGEPVRHLQERLTALGHPVDDEPGTFGQSTQEAVVAFQRRRGLTADGVCGEHTWAAAEEAGYRFGDRWLYDARPMMRGDDVSELQQRLGKLGFDAGRIDGIFGPDTARACSEFQRNAGLTVDGICGRETFAALARLGRRDSQSPLEPVPVTEVRERERLRSAAPTLAGRRIALGHGGSLDAVIAAVARAVAQRGALGVPLHQTDGEELALSANTLVVDAYVGFEAVEADGLSVCYWQSPLSGSASPGGHHLAKLLQESLAKAVSVADLGARGMAFPVLRRTRMPAVVCLVPADAREDLVRGATSVADALERWASSPC